MVELADQARREYEPHAPVFQRPAHNAREVHRPWLSLTAAKAWAKERGAAQVVVVAGPHDGPKRAVLQDAGLYVASEWFTAPLDH